MKTKTKLEAATCLQFKIHTIAATAAMMLLLPIVARGNGVVTHCTEADLRAAMAGGGLVTFACDGTITLAGTVTNSADTMLDAAGHQITISGGNMVRVFWVRADATLTLVNLTIANGAASDGGGVQNSGGTVNATNCTFAGNSATNKYPGLVRGGAIFNESGLVQLLGCDFSGNQARATLMNGIGGAGARGGAICNGGTVIIDLCKFSGNVAAGAPGGWQMGAGMGGSGSGGAIFNGGTLEVRRGAFVGNEANGAAAGSGSMPGDPGGDGKGGAICNQGNLWLAGSTLANNGARGGTGGTGANGHAWMDIATDGGAGGTGGLGAGGGLFNSGTASAINNTFTGDFGHGGSGGIAGAGGNGMRAGGHGGSGGAGGAGFGAVCDTSGLLRMTNCTLAFNTGSGGAGGPGGIGGGGQLPGATGNPGTNGVSAGGINSIGCLLAHTLLATNSGNCFGRVIDGAHNLSSDGTCVFTNVGSLNFTDPKLAQLADNGGPTLTMALLAGSLAIDAGDTNAAPPTDQRGVPRSFGAASDIGAYEYATMLRIKQATGAGLEIRLCDGLPGQTCRLLTSTTHSNWVCVSTNQVGADGTFLFQEDCNTAEPRRFYKAVLP